MVVHGEGSGSRLRHSLAAGIRVPLQALQIRAQFRGELVSHVPILLQGLAHDPFKLRGQIRFEFQKWYWGFVQDGVKDDRRRISRKRRPASRHLIEHRAEG